MVFPTSEHASATQCAPRPAWPPLGVVIPAYNEASTIGRVLEAVQAVGIARRVVVVDDGSDDGTADQVRACAPSLSMEVKLVEHGTNRGKAAAIRTALALIEEPLVVVQDADLECDPCDIVRLLECWSPEEAPVVYGSRYLGSGRPRHRRSWRRFGVLVLNFYVLALYGRRLTDEACCYKLMPSPLLKSLDLRANRFEFCPEVTAKLSRLGWPIVEVPVGYWPRTKAEGKKLRLRDGLSAIRTLLWWRIAPLPSGAERFRATKR